MGTPQSYHMGVRHVPRQSLRLAKVEPLIGDIDAGTYLIPSVMGENFPSAMWFPTVEWGEQPLQPKLRLW